MKRIPTFCAGIKLEDNYYDFIKVLGIELENLGYIQYWNNGLMAGYSKSNWMYIFSGLDDYEGENVFSWQKEKNHCIYLIDRLVSDGILVNEKINSKIERFFNIKNAAQTRYSFYPGKPKGADQIDGIISRCLKSL